MVFCHFFFSARPNNMASANTVEITMHIHVAMALTRGENATARAMAAAKPASFGWSRIQSLIFGSFVTGGIIPTLRVKHSILAKAHLSRPRKKRNSGKNQKDVPPACRGLRRSQFDLRQDPVLFIAGCVNYCGLQGKPIPVQPAPGQGTRKQKKARQRTE